MAIEVLQIERLSSSNLILTRLEGDVVDGCGRGESRITCRVGNGRCYGDTARIIRVDTKGPVADCMGHHLVDFPFRRRIANSNTRDQRLVQRRKALCQPAVLHIRSSGKSIHRLGPCKSEIYLKPAGEPLVGGELKPVIPTAPQRRVDYANGGEL